MATNKKGNGKALTSLFETIDEKGFGDVGAEDLKTPRISIVQRCLHRDKKRLLIMWLTQRKEIFSSQATTPL